MAAPTFGASYNSVWNTSATKTLTVTTQAGDRIVVGGGSEDSPATLNTPTGNSLTYTLAQSIVVANYCATYAWTATDAAGGTNWSLAVTGNIPGGQFWGITAYVFRDSDGFGASAKTNVTTGAPSLALTTGQADSAIVCVNADWNTVDGASRTWRTINGITPTAGNGLEKNYFRDAVRYAAYNAYWDNAGAAGSKTTGLSAPSGQAYGIIAVEVLGTAGGAPDPKPRGALVAPSAAAMRASAW